MDVLDSPYPIVLKYGLCRRKATLNLNCLPLRAQKLCESRGGRPELPAPNSFNGLCGHKASLKLSLSELRSCVEVEVAVLGSLHLIVLYGLCGHKASLKLEV